MKRRIAFAAAALVALSACQSTGQGDAADAAGRLNTMESLPLNAYMPSTASNEAKTIDKATWMLAKQCMIDVGYGSFSMFDTKTAEWTYPVREGRSVGNSTTGGNDLYGVDDPDQASEQGYHNPQLDDSQQPLEWPADQYTALTGVFEAGDSHTPHGHPIPEGGCLGQSARKIYGSGLKTRKINGIEVHGASLALYLWSNARSEAQKHPRWKKADHKWSACMKGKGFTYPDPIEASYDPAWQTSRSVSAKEKKTATADARCKLKTGYIDEVHAVEVRVQKDTITKYKKDLGRLRKADEGAVKKARAVIARQSDN